MEIAVWPKDFKIKTKRDATRFQFMRDEPGFGKKHGTAVLVRRNHRLLLEC